MLRWVILIMLFAIGLTACQVDEVGPVPSLTTLAPSPAPSTPVHPAATQTAALPQSPPPTNEPPVQAPPTPLPQPSHTPAPVLRQLTSGGCCAEPFWSADGSLVLYLDRPAPQAPAGFYGLSPLGGEPALFTDQLGIYSPDMTLRAYPENGTTFVERLEDGQRWTIPSAGRLISFSPDGAWVAWTMGQSGPPFDTPERNLWISAFDGSEARRVLTLYGGGFAGWFPDGRMLVSGRLDRLEQQAGYFIFNPSDGSVIELVRGHRLRNASLSPGGSWLAYLEIFSPAPDQNGLWLLSTLTGERRRLDLFGAFRWRNDTHLLLVPLDPSAPAHRLYEIEAATGLAQPLTDPAVTPIKIANNSWEPSPDGQRILFVSAVDHNIWLLELP